MIFLTVFILSFISADFLITGSVTNTWIGIAVLTGVVTAGVRQMVFSLFGRRSRHGEPKHDLRQS